MTMMDLGPERPGTPSETRQLGEFGRAATDHYTLSGKTFWIALVVIAALIVVFAVTR